MKISGTNKEIVEIISLLDPSFKCKCLPNANRFICNSKHDRNCIFEEQSVYGIDVRIYNIEYDGNKITKVVCMQTFQPNSNILNGTVL